MVMSDSYHVCRRRALLRRTSGGQRIHPVSCKSWDLASTAAWIRPTIFKAFDIPSSPSGLMNGPCFWKVGGLHLPTPGLMGAQLLQDSEPAITRPAMHFLFSTLLCHIQLCSELIAYA